MQVLVILNVNNGENPICSLAVADLPKGAIRRRIEDVKLTEEMANKLKQALISVRSQEMSEAKRDAENIRLTEENKRLQRRLDEALGHAPEPVVAVE